MRAICIPSCAAAAAAAATVATAAARGECTSVRTCATAPPAKWTAARGRGGAGAGGGAASTWAVSAVSTRPVSARAVAAAGAPVGSIATASGIHASGIHASMGVSPAAAPICSAMAGSSGARARRRPPPRGRNTKLARGGTITGWLCASSCISGARSASACAFAPTSPPAAANTTPCAWTWRAAAAAAGAGESGARGGGARAAPFMRGIGMPDSSYSNKPIVAQGLCQV